ncbi:MAG: DUF6057 family protein [Phocaeicola sp.]
MIRKLFLASLIFGILFYIIFVLAAHTIYALGAKSSLFLNSEALILLLGESGWLARLLDNLALQFSAYYLYFSLFISALLLFELFLIHHLLPKIGWIKNGSISLFTTALIPVSVLMAFSVSPHFSLIPLFATLITLLFITLSVRIKLHTHFIYSFLSLLFLYYLVGLWALLFVVFTLVQQKTRVLLVCLPLTLALLPFVESYLAVMPWNYYYRSLAERETIVILSITSLTFVMALFRFRAYSIPFLVTVVCSIALFLKEYNPREKVLINIERCMNEQRWDDLIHVASKYPHSNILKTYAINLSLIKSDRLAYEVLDYPQRFGEEGLFISAKVGEMRNAFSHHLYAALGFYNEAHRLIWESSTTSGLNRINLSYLQFYNQQLGRDKIAHKFENKLNKTLFSGEYSTFIDRSTYPKPLPHLESTTQFTNIFSLSRDLLYLSRYDLHTKQSAELLLVSLLLSNRLLDFAENAHLIETFYANGIPDLYHQALALLKAAMPREQFEKIGIEPSAKAVSDYENYGKTYRNSSGNRSELVKYKTTLFYYIHFISPYGSKVVTQ